VRLGLRRIFAFAEEFLSSVVPESHGCVILDFGLPATSGFELVDHVSASIPPRPVIFITARDEESLRERASTIPNTVYLRKPFVGAVLLEVLRSLAQAIRPKWKMSPVRPLLDFQDCSNGAQ
jgi:FixJ family two-component response regulator